MAPRGGPIPDFERAADAIVSGDLPTLRALLQADPELVRARSSREHHSTLLHYVSANGVEGIRQRTPPNAVEIARVLLDAGAEVDAVSDAYAGDSTTLYLVVSSVHPARAGLQIPLAELLLDYGAAVEGRAGDGVPLRAAISFFYPATAEALVRRGAKIRDLGTAAALGRTELVHRFIDDGADLAAQDPLGFTPLHWAAFNGHLETVEALLERGAPLDPRNRWGGDVIGSTEWAAANGGLDVDYGPILERLRKSLPR